MTQTNNTLGVWVRIAAVVIPLAVAGLIGFGMIRAQVSNNDRAIGRVETQATAARTTMEQRMDLRLTRIEDKLDRLLELRLQDTKASR